MIDNFNSENAQRLSDDIIDLLNQNEGTIVEKVFAVTHVLHAIGETMYDRTMLEGSPWNKTIMNPPPGPQL